MEILKFLEDEGIQESLQTIQKWYSSPSLIDRHINFKSVADLKLLRLFNEKEFYPAVFRKMEAFIEKEKRCGVFIDLACFLDVLAELGCQDELCYHLNEKQDVLQSLKVHLERHLDSCFQLNSSKLIALVSRLVPDWQKHLLAWTRDEIQRNKDEAGTYRAGIYRDKCRIKPSYSLVVELFQQLEKVGMFNDFRILLKSPGSGIAPSDFNDVYDKFVRKSRPESL